jgi:hypothetical protein
VQQFWTVTLHRTIFVGCSLLCAVGCQLLGGARIKEMASGSAKPSNVATFVAVTHKDKPVAGLPASSFRISENDQPIDAETAQLQLLETARFATFHAVLLVDISQANQPALRRALAKAAGAFVRRVRQGQPVTVVAYDGSDKVRLVGDFPTDARAAAPEQVDALLTLSPGDPSRNLRGAIVQGLEILDRHLSASGGPVRLGTLAVFARGPDLAGRYPSNKFDDALSASVNKLVFIGVTGDGEDNLAKRVSQDGQVRAQSGDTLPIAFEDAGALVDGLLAQYYLLSYCSPSRAGKRSLKVTVSVPVEDGKDETASFDTHFDASGFTAGCDSQKAPTLVSKASPSSGATNSAAAGPESNGKPSGNAPAGNESRKSSTKAADDDEAPVPAKPGYAH